MCYPVNFETEILHHHGVTHAISILIQRQTLGEFEVILFLISIQSLPSFENMSTGVCFCFDFLMWTFPCLNQNSLFLISHKCFPTPSADSSFTHLSGIPARNISMESFIWYCYQSSTILLSVHFHFYLRGTFSNLKLWIILMWLWKRSPAWWPNISMFSDTFICMESKLDSKIKTRISLSLALLCL